MPERSGRDLLGEWRKLMDGVVASAASVGSRADLPRQLVEPMQRQLELVQEVIERERKLQKQLTGRVLAPVDAVFDLLADSGTVLRRQAEALEAAGAALQETAALVKSQAELFERTMERCGSRPRSRGRPPGLSAGHPRAAEKTRRRPSDRTDPGPLRARSRPPIASANARCRPARAVLH